MTVKITYRIKNNFFRPFVPRLGIITCRRFHGETAPVKEIKIPVPWGHLAGKLWGKTNGQHRPILALHGWMDNAGSWDALAPMICDQRPILALDFPGHGYSSWIPPGIQYYPWDTARAISTVKNHFQWDKITLLAHSMGSMLAMRFACVFPDEVDGFIAVDSLFPEDYKNMNKFLNWYTEKLRNIQFLQGHPNFEPKLYSKEAIFEKWHLGSKKSVLMEGVKHLSKRGIKQSTKDTSKYYFSCDPRIPHTFFDPQNILLHRSLAQRLKCPTLFIKAIDSTFSSSNIFAELRQIIEENNPYFESYIIPGTHHVHLNHPEMVKPLIIKFLKKYNFI